MGKKNVQNNTKNNEMINLMDNLINSRKGSDESKRVIFKACMELYSKEVDTYRLHRNMILITCIAIIASFSAAICYLLVVVVGGDEGVASNVKELIAGCGTYLATIFAILHTITKHVFGTSELDFIKGLLVKATDDIADSGKEEESENPPS